MSRPFHLSAFTRLPRLEALAAARSALDQGGASVVAITHYAEKASVIQFEARPAAIEVIAVALRRQGVIPDDATLLEPGLLAVDSYGDANGTLQILYAGAEPARVDEVPVVPG